jgi:hypothetical protein
LLGLACLFGLVWGARQLGGGLTYTSQRAPNFLSVSSSNFFQTSLLQSIGFASLVPRACDREHYAFAPRTALPRSTLARTRPRRPTRKRLMFDLPLTHSEGSSPTKVTMAKTTSISLPRGYRCTERALATWLISGTSVIRSRDRSVAVEARSRVWACLRVFATSRTITRLRRTNSPILAHSALAERGVRSPT